MKLLAQLNPRPRGFGDGSYYRIRDLSATLKMTRETEILSPDGSRMTKGDNAKYILCHSGTSESEVIESKKKK